MARRRLKKRAKAGEAKVAIAEDEHLAGHEKKPAAGDGIIEFQTRPMVEKGRSSSAKRCQRLKR